ASRPPAARAGEGGAPWLRRAARAWPTRALAMRMSRLFARAWAIRACSGGSGKKCCQSRRAMEGPGADSSAYRSGVGSAGCTYCGANEQDSADKQIRQEIQKIQRRFPNLE